MCIRDRHGDNSDNQPHKEKIHCHRIIGQQEFDQMAESENSKSHPQHHGNQKADALFKFLFQMADRTDQLVVNIQQNRQCPSADAGDCLLYTSPLRGSLPSIRSAKGGSILF